VIRKKLLKQKELFAMKLDLIEATEVIFTEWAKDVPDPRLACRVVYPLLEILFALFIGQLCGMDDIDEIVLFANMELGWFQKIMLFKNGVAPAQTIRRVLSALDTKAFEALFTAWSAQWRGQGVVAIDGKCLRGASEKGTHNAIYTVSAFAHRAGLVLGQQKVCDKSNEITAIPALLERLSLRGNIVTIDAMGTQSKIAEAIRAKEADYILALKGNQSNLHEDVARFFEDNVLSSACATHKTIDAGHGRIEERFIRVIDARDWLCAMHQQWKDLRSIVAIMSTRTQKKTGQASTETRYYITSLPPDPVLLLDAVRSHWGIENTLHWSLDVTFGEDKSRLRKDNAAANMAIIRKAAFNTLKQEPSKMSLKLKRLKAAHDPVFRSALINRS
jgi:predicted transposase YbfD/YdcC